jgi:hypothetical protein
VQHGCGMVFLILQIYGKVMIIMMGWQFPIRRILLKDAEIAVIHYTYPRSMREHINAVMKIEEDTAKSYVLYDEEDYQRMKRTVSNSSKRIKKAFSEIENMN